MGTRRGNRGTPLDIIAFLTAVDDVSLGCDGRNDFASGVGFGGLTCKAKAESTKVHTGLFEPNDTFSIEK